MLKRLNERIRRWAGFWHQQGDPRRHWDFPLSLRHLESRRVLDASFALQDGVLALQHLGNSQSLTLSDSSNPAFPNHYDFSLNQGTWQGISTPGVEAQGNTLHVAKSLVGQEISIQAGSLAVTSLDVIFASLDVAAPQLTIEHAGHLTQIANTSLIANQVTITANSVSLTNPNNQFDQLSAQVDQQIEVVDRDSLVLGDLEATNATIDVGEDLTQTAAANLRISDQAQLLAGRNLAIGVTRTVPNGGSVAAQDFTQIGRLNFHAGNRATIASDGPIELTGTNQANSVWLQAHGTIRGVADNTRIVADTAQIDLIVPQQADINRPIDLDLMGNNEVANLRLDVIADPSITASPVRDIRWHDVAPQAHLTSFLAHSPALTVQDVVLWFENSTLEFPSTQVRVSGDLLALAGLSTTRNVIHVDNPLALAPVNQVGLLTRLASDFFDQQLVRASGIVGLATIEDASGFKLDVAGNATLVARDYVVLANVASADRLHVGGNLFLGSKDSAFRIGVPDIDPPGHASFVSQGDVQLGSVTLIGTSHGEIFAESDLVLTGANRLTRLDLETQGTIRDDITATPNRPANPQTSILATAETRLVGQSIHIGALGLDVIPNPIPGNGRPVGRVELGKLTFDAHGTAFIAVDTNLQLAGASRGTQVFLQSAGTIRELANSQLTRASVTADSAQIQVLTDVAASTFDIDLLGPNAIRDAQIELVHGVNGGHATLQDIFYRNTDPAASANALQGVFDASPRDAFGRVTVEDMVVWFDQASAQLNPTDLHILGDSLWVAGWNEGSPLPFADQTRTAGDLGLFPNQDWTQSPLTYFRKSHSAANEDITDSANSRWTVDGNATFLASRDIVLADQATNTFRVAKLASFLACDGSIFVGVAPASLAALPTTTSPEFLGGRTTLGEVQFQSLREFTPAGSRTMVAIFEDDTTLLTGHNLASGDLWLVSSGGIADRDGTRTEFSANAHLASIDALGHRGTIVLGNGSALWQANHATRFHSAEGFVSLFAQSAALTTHQSMNVGSTAERPFDILEDLILRQVDGSLVQVVESSVIAAPNVYLETTHAGAGSPGAIVLWRMDTHTLSAVSNGNIAQDLLPIIPRVGDRYGRSGNVFDPLPTQNTVEGRANRPFDDTILDLSLPQGNPYAIVFVNGPDLPGLAHALELTNRTLHAEDANPRGAPEFAAGLGISTMAGHVYVENSGPIQIVDAARSATPEHPITLVSVGTDAHHLHPGQTSIPYLFTANAIQNGLTIGEYEDAQGHSVSLSAGSIWLQSATGVVTSVKHANGNKFDVGPLIQVTPRSRTSPTFGNPAAGPPTSEFVVPDAAAPDGFRQAYLQNFEIRVGSPGERHFILAFVWHDSQVDVNNQVRFAGDQPSGFTLYPEIFEVRQSSASAQILVSPSGSRLVSVVTPSLTSATALGNSFLQVSGNQQSGGMIQVNAQHLFDVRFIETNPFPTLMPTSVVVFNDPLINLLQTPVGGEAETNSVLADLNEARVGFNLNERLTDNGQSEPGFVLAFTVNLKITGEIPRDIPRSTVYVAPPISSYLVNSNTTVNAQPISGGLMLLADEIGLVEYGIVSSETQLGESPHWKKKWVFNGPRDGEGAFLDGIEQEIRAGHLDEYPIGAYEIWIHYQHNPVPQKARFLEKTPEWITPMPPTPGIPAMNLESSEEPAPNASRAPQATPPAPETPPDLGSHHWTSVIVMGTLVATPRSSSGPHPCERGLRTAFDWRARTLRRLARQLSSNRAVP